MNVILLEQCSPAFRKMSWSSNLPRSVPYTSRNQRSLCDRLGPRGRCQVSSPCRLLRGCGDRKGRWQSQQRKIYNRKTKQKCEINRGGINCKAS